MTTMQRTMSPAARLTGFIARLFSNEKRRASLILLRRPGRNRDLHDLSDWTLRDIGLEREDVMSPEARRTLNRFKANMLW